VIGGLLILIHKPTAEDCAENKRKSGKLCFGRIHNFGISFEATCDVRGRFLDISIIPQDPLLTL
jgi:hypothetical protein